MKFTAVLLAGGASQRMGRDKAALTFGVQKLWQRQIDTLLACAPVEVLISGRFDGPWRGTNLRVIEDGVEGGGPLRGIATALDEAVTDLLLVLAVDMPLMDSKFLLNLLSVAKEAGVVPFLGGRFEPLAAVYPLDVHPLAQYHLTNREYSLQSFVRAGVEQQLLQVRQVAVEEEPYFTNVNTFEELDRLLQTYPPAPPGHSATRCR